MSDEKLLELIYKKLGEEFRDNFLLEYEIYLNEGGNKDINEFFAYYIKIHYIDYSKILISLLESDLFKQKDVVRIKRDPKGIEFEKNLYDDSKERTMKNQIETDFKYDNFSDNNNQVNYKVVTKEEMMNYNKHINKIEKIINKAGAIRYDSFE